MRLLLALLMTVLFCLALATPLPAQPKDASPSLEYKKQGFFVGADLAGLVGFVDGGVIGAPGKFDILAGYQINPYISVAADLWTFWFVAYGAEAHVKANFTDSKISPYAVATVGVFGDLVDLADEGGDGSGLTYSAGIGTDFRLWRNRTLFAEVKYRGASGFSSDSGNVVHGLEVGVGLRWTF